MSIEFFEDADKPFSRQPDDSPRDVRGAIPPQPVTAVGGEVTQGTNDTTDEQSAWQPPETVRRVIGAAAAQAETFSAVDPATPGNLEGAVSDPSESIKPETGLNPLAGSEEPPVAASSGSNDKPPIKYPPAPGAAEPSEPERPEQAELAALDIPSVGEQNQKPAHATKEQIVATAAEVASQSPSPQRARTIGVFTGNDKATLQIAEFGLDFYDINTHCDAMYRTGLRTIESYENNRHTSDESSSAEPIPDTYIVDTVTTAHSQEGGHVLVQKVYSSPDGGTTKGSELITKTEIHIPQAGDEESLMVTMLSHDNSSPIEMKSLVMSPEQDALYERCSDIFGEGSLATSIVVGNHEPGVELEIKLEELRAVCHEMGVYSPDEVDNVITELREIASVAYRDPSLRNELTPAQLDRLATFVQECSSPEADPRAGQPGAAPLTTDEDAPLLLYAFEYGSTPEPTPDRQAEKSTPVQVTPNAIVALASEVATDDTCQYRVHTKGVVDTHNRLNFQVQRIVPPVTEPEVEEEVAEEVAMVALAILNAAQTDSEVRDALKIPSLEPSAYIVENFGAYHPKNQGHMQVQKIYSTPDNGITRGDELITVTLVQIPSRKSHEGINAEFFSRKDVDTIVTHISALSPMHEAIYRKTVGAFGNLSMAADIAKGAYAPGPDLEEALEHFENTTRAAGVYSEAEITRYLLDLREAASLAHASRSMGSQDARLERIRRFVQELQA